MALSSDDLNQIRDVVRTELKQKSGLGIGKIILAVIAISIIIFVAVLALHAFVIGGFTVYHLMHSS